MSEGKSSFTLNKKFVSEDQLDEQRRKRQEEWEKVRKPDQPLEAPEEEYDPRSLYDRLQEQKQRKQDEYEAQFALKNQVKGLEDGEVDFLDYVSDRQIEIEKERKQEMDEVLSECRNVVTVKESGDKSSKPAKSQSARGGGGKKSQSQLLAGAVKRKSSSTGETEEKKSKLTDSDTAASTETTPVSESDATPASLNQDPPHGPSVPPAPCDSSLPTLQVAGVLPGLGMYSDSDLSSDTSSSEDEPTRRGRGAQGVVVVGGQKVYSHPQS